MQWDVFISHSGRDKPFVRQLASALQTSGVSVWYDEFMLSIGDSLRRSIDHGLANSRFGIVVLSPSFLGSEWPLKELDALVARDDGRQKVILPIWLGTDADNIRKLSPLLADKVAILGDAGIERVVSAILRVVAGPAPDDEAQRRIAHRIRRLVEEIEDETAASGERVAAINALRRIGPPAASAALSLAGRLSDNNKKVAASAASALKALGLGGSVAIPALAHAVVVGDYEVAENAADALGKLGPAAAEAIPSLIIALSRWDVNYLNIRAAEALAAIGPAAVPALIELLGRESIPYFTFMALQGLGPSAVAAVPVLRRTLSRADQINHYGKIARILGAIGPQASDAIPELLQIVNAAPLDSGESVGQAAHAIVSAGMDPKDAGEVLGSALRRSKGSYATQELARALARLGETGARHLAAALADDDKIAYYSADALGEMGSGAALAVPALLDVLNRKHSSINDIAVKALGKIGQAARLAIPKLIEQAEKGDGYSIEALGKIEPPDASAVPTLITVLQQSESEESEWFLVKILEALAAYGKKASEARSCIQLKLQHENERVREAAQRAEAAVQS